MAKTVLDVLKERLEEDKSSAVEFLTASWKFFKDRIPIEETALAHKYGKKYEEYRGKTIIGIPFI